MLRQSMYGGSEAVALQTGAIVRCSYDGEIVVTLGQGPDQQVVKLPTPEAGLGGLELVVSPDEQYAALLVYSGQSEQGWEVFALAPQLQHVARLPYVLGEGLAPVFSTDSRHLAMIVTCAPRERGTGEDAEALLDPEARGEVLIDWAVLYVQELPSGAVEASPVGTWIKRSMEPAELLGWDLYESLRFVGKRRLELPLPWGTTLELRIPLGGPVTTPSPVPDTRSKG